MALPPDRQAMVKRAFQDLRSVPLDQRATVLNSARYQKPVLARRARHPFEFVARRALRAAPLIVVWGVATFCEAPSVTGWRGISMTSTVFATLMLLSALATQAPEPKGTVSVTVINQKGNPVDSATVKLDPEHGGMLYVSPTCKTDSAGKCTRDGLQMDAYLLGAMKPSDGYPNLSPEFYSHETKRMEVVLTAANPHANIVFRLGPPMAKLKLTFVDDLSGVPINNPTIILRGGSGPHDWISIGRTADSTVLVPPDRDVHLEISGDGYQPWHLEEHPGPQPTRRTASPLPRSAGDGHSPTGSVMG